MTKRCKRCCLDKVLLDFVKDARCRGGRRNICRDCRNLGEDKKLNTRRVDKYRKNVKRILVAEHGGKCLDCGFIGPQCVFDFDHRDPSEKKFTLSAGSVLSLDRQREEAAKCDLVCANCHRMRTHRQRCDGCIDCTGA